MAEAESECLTLDHQVCSWQKQESTRGLPHLQLSLSLCYTRSLNKSPLDFGGLPHSYIRFPSGVPRPSGSTLREDWGRRKSSKPAHTHQPLQMWSKVLLHMWGECGDATWFFFITSASIKERWSRLTCIRVSMFLLTSTKREQWCVPNNFFFTVNAARKWPIHKTISTLSAQEYFDEQSQTVINAFGKGFWFIYGHTGSCIDSRIPTFLSL